MSAHHRRWQICASVILGGVALFQAYRNYGPVTAEGGGLLLAFAVTALSGTSFLVAAGNSWQSAKVRQALVFLALSNLTLAAGHFLRFIYALGVPTPWIPNLDLVSEFVIWLLVFMALIRLPLAPVAPEHRWRAALDILISFLGMLLVVAVIWMLPGLRDAPAGPRHRLIFYNLMEAGNLFVINLILARGPVPEIRSAVRWTVAGIATDTVYLVIFQFLTGCENYDGRLLNGLFYFDCLIFVLAGFHFLVGPQPAGRISGQVRLLKSINPLPFCATVIVGALLVVSAIQHRTQAVVLLSCGMAVMTFLLLVRVAMSARESLRLAQERYDTEQQAQERTMRLTRRLAGGISHVINNQMTAVLGNAQLLGEASALTGQELGMLNTIGKSARLASGLAGRLLLASGSRRLMMETCWPLARAVAARRDVLARTSSSGGIPCTILWDLTTGQGEAPVAPSDIEAILRELLANATESMGNSAGEVTVRVRDEAVPSGSLQGPSPGNYSVLEVTDSGPGFAPEALPQAAEPFFSTRPESEGRGLGLSVVQGIASRYHGALRIDNLPGAGARIRVYLPVVPPAPAS